MKATLRDDGFVEISAETIAEAYAIRHLFNNDHYACGQCGRIDVPVIINSNTPNEQKKFDDDA